MSKNTPEYNREYYEKNRRRILEERRLRYRIDLQFKEDVRRYNRDAYVPVSLRYPYEVKPGMTMLNKDTVETVDGLYYSTRSLARKIGCSTRYLRDFLNEKGLNERALKIETGNYYSDDVLDIAIDTLREEGIRVRMR